MGEGGVENPEKMTTSFMNGPSEPLLLCTTTQLCPALSALPAPMIWPRDYVVLVLQVCRIFCIKPTTFVNWIPVELLLGKRTAVEFLKNSKAIC